MKAAKKRAAALPPGPQRAGKSLGAIEQIIPGAKNSGQRICWRFQYVDDDSPWGISKLTPPEMAALVSKLVDFESQTMHELFNHGEEPGKHYEPHRIPNSLARARLTALKLGDMTRVSRLRLGGKPRLYGFLIENVFHVLWWDREHEVWPSPKKHT
ncbi:hypothetical protein OG689_10845 [Kitasatospora sp. NBC_00240]|uniref:hypothetical protein n=1 Tax=Kitasatospora sp. NBC_00240 TaxID=2903567 RepID=UPI00225BD99C|nr:hypothetical protein [Kitasatospora sp. NBC_00240]MCX5209781.1 hypothetical protein [Kitasatospora sp. NBC_00240]